MRSTLLIDGQPSQWVVYNLCSQDGAGDYEGFADRVLQLNLPKIAARLEVLGYLVEGFNEQILLANQGEQALTIFPEGRLIMEGVRPDEAARAAHILTMVLNE